MSAVTLSLTTDELHVVDMVPVDGPPAVVLAGLDDEITFALREGTDIPLVDFVAELLRQVCVRTGQPWPEEPIDIDALALPGPPAFYGYHAWVAS
jgi:hypothetical protein